jgi:hypothetical protein
VTAAAAFVFELAGSSDFHSFGQTLMGFLFRHFTNSFEITCITKTIQKYKVGSLRYL